MKIFLKRVYQVSRKNWISLVWFEIIYRIATSILITQAGNFIIDFSLKRQDYSYLTAENYLNFIKNPNTILLGILLLVFLALITLIEIQAIFAYFRYGTRNQRLYAIEMLTKGIKKAFFFIKEHPFFWGIYILATLPFLGIHFLIREISNIKILEYTAQQLYKVVPSTWLIVVTLVVVFVISMIISFSLPYCILEKEKAHKAIKRALKLLYVRKGTNLVGIFLVQVLVIITTLTVYLLSALIMVACVVLFLKPTYRLSGVLYYGAWLKNAIGIFAGSFGMMFGILYIGLFYTAKESRSSIVWRQTGSGKRWFSKKRRRYLAVFLTCIISVGEVTYLVNLSRSSNSISKMSSQTPTVTAHRGGALMTPENTISAIQYSVESLCDFAEIDVQETKDGVVVLLHDTNLKRVTGLNEDIWELNYSEIVQLDAGVKFNIRFLGEKIPTLDEVLEYAEGKIKLNIEIKANGHNENIVSKVLHSIEKYNYQDSCVVTSMDYRFLRQVKELNPDIITGYTMTMAYGSVGNLRDADFVSVKGTCIDRRFVEAAHANGKEVHAWTVNYPGDVKRLVSCGVDNIITDNPSLVHEVYLGEQGAGTGFIDLMAFVLK